MNISTYAYGYRIIAPDEAISRRFGKIEASSSFNSGFDVSVGDTKVEAFPSCQHHDDTMYWAVRDDSGRLRVLSQTGCGAGYDQFTGDVETYKVFGPYAQAN